MNMPRGPSGAVENRDGSQSRHRRAAREAVIELRLRDGSQLFDSLDPSPLGERDLERHVEEFIVGSARELRTRNVNRLVIFLVQPTALFGDHRAMGDAVCQYFAGRARVLKYERQALIRRGLISLVIGTAFLATVVGIGQLVPLWLGEGGIATLLQEGIAIVGWVAMWRPLEIFLYDWWPILGMQRLYDRLARVDVQVVQLQQASDPPTTTSRPQ